MPPYISPGAPPDPDAGYPWWRRWLVATDQWFNVTFLDGLPDETISSHSGRLLRDGHPPLWARLVCALCNLFQTDHCKRSIGS